MSSTVIKKLFYFVTLLCLFLSPVSTGKAQANIGLSIDQIENGNFPEVEVFISVLDGQGYPIKDLTSSEISVSEDGRNISSIEIVPTAGQIIDVALVIDTSNSLGYGIKPTPMENVVETGKSFVDSLSPEDQIAIIAFSDQVSILQDLTTDKSLAKNALETLVPSGNAALNDSILEAINLLKGSSHRTALVLITDGVDSGESKITFQQAMDEGIRQKVPMYPIAWGGASRKDLTMVAELTHGKAQFLSGNQPELTSFQAAFSVVSNTLPDLRGQYKIRFDSGVPADGKEHELVVKVDYLGEHVEQSRRFVALPGEMTIELPGFNDGQEAGGSIHFSPKINSPGPVSRLDISLDGTLLTSILSTPFEFMWDSTTVPAGPHELTFVATDSAGNSAEAFLNLVVRPPVTVEIMSPIEGETLSGTALISANVAAPFSKISQVEFLVDGEVIETLESEPFEIEWDLSGLSAGSHIIDVIAYDINGMTDKRSANVNIALQQGSGLVWLAIIVVLAVAAIIFPFAYRGRRKMRQSRAATVEQKREEGVVPVEINSGQSFLRELEGMNPNRLWPLLSEEVRLGRKRDENDIHLKGSNASRKHAIIRPFEGYYVVYSLNPENPVLVNDVPINQQQVLQTNDVIRVGETVLRYEVQS